MASQAAIKSALEGLATNMKAAELTDAQWADQMATIIYNAITGRAVLTTVTGTLPDGAENASGDGTVQA